MDHSEGEGFAALPLPSQTPLLDVRAILRPFALLADVAFSNFVARCASPENYQVFLEQTLFYVSETVPTLTRVTRENPEHPLVSDLMRLAIEETGHDDMIRQDLALLGGTSSAIPISPALQEYVALARSLPVGANGISILCGDIVAMEGYPPTAASVTWLADRFGVQLAACSALMEHASADAIHGPLAFKRLAHPAIDSSLAIGRAIATLRLFTRHWEWLTERCGTPVRRKTIILENKPS